MTHRIDNLPVLGTPGTVLAAVPYLLGFHPESSAVLLILEQHPSAVRVTMRVDLPSPEDLHSWVDQVAQIASRAGIGGRRALLMGFGSPACAEALHLLRERLTRQDGTILDVLVADESTAESTWYHLTADGHPCCGERHVVSRRDRRAARRLLHRAGHPLGAEPRRRADVVAEVAPIPGATLAVAPVPLPTPQTRELAVAHIHDLLLRAEDAPPEAVALAVASLRDVHVRDTLLWDLLHQDSRRWASCADALAGWVRQMPESYVAPAATVLAVLRWQCGDGTRGAVALERALTADPDYRLAVLVRAVIDAGEPPRRWLEGLCGMSRESCLGRAA